MKRPRLLLLLAPCSRTATLLAPTLLVAALLTAGGCALRPPEPPPDYGAAPDFELVDQNGRTVGPSDLAGRPVVLDVIFTRCVAVCPVMSAQMERIGRGLPEGADGDSFARVSITLDPDHDTREVLADYAAKRGAPEDWLFLRADSQEATVTLVREGYKLAVDVDTGDPANEIVHSTRFVLIDAQGHIRGWYDALTPEDMEELKRDLGTLLRS